MSDNVKKGTIWIDNDTGVEYELRKVFGAYRTVNDMMLDVVTKYVMLKRIGVAHMYPFQLTVEELLEYYKLKGD